MITFHSSWNHWWCSGHTTYWRTRWRVSVVRDPLPHVKHHQIGTLLDEHFPLLPNQVAMGNKSSKLPPNQNAWWLSDLPERSTLCIDPPGLASRCQLASHASEHLRACLCDCPGKYLSLVAVPRSSKACGPAVSKNKLQYLWRPAMRIRMPAKRPSSRNCRQLLGVLLWDRTPPVQLLQLPQGP